MDCSTTSYRQGLQQITAVAQSLKPSIYSAFSRAGVEPPPRANTRHNSGATPPALSLPLPDEIISSLLCFGCSRDSARSLSNAFIHSARQIRDAYESTYWKLAVQFNSDPGRLSTRLKNTSSLLERKYREQILAAERVAIDQAKKLQQTTRSKTKPVFNQEFVPLLETYFEYNAYPSAPDRVSLARKSMMTPRQIEVWFQNHRNRSKKEGRPLRKLTSDPLPLKLSFESLEKGMPLFIIPENERRAPVDWDSKEEDVETQASTTTTTLNGLNTFKFETPPHAFPTTFPPHCSYDPFPVETKSYSFPPPIWMRTPATTLPSHRTPTLDALIADFATKLNLRDQLSKERRKDPSSSVPKSAWFAATQTIPSPAPHPAFIRPIAPVRAPSTLRLSTRMIPISSTRQSPPRYTGSFSQYATHVAGAQPRSPTTSRKVAPLPRRSPTSPSFNHRGVSPMMSEAPSPSRSISSNSRTSSFSSDFLSTRRLSSSSSSSSSFSSTPNTPCSSPEPDTNSFLYPSIVSSNGDDHFLGDSINLCSTGGVLPRAHQLLPSKSQTNSYFPAVYTFPKH